MDTPQKTTDAAAKDTAKADVAREKEAMQQEIEKQDTAAISKDKHLGLVGKRILWVEDDKFLGNIVSKRMGEYKCEMFLAKNGEEAFKYLAEQKQLPHIVVLDLVLPGMSGFDILKKIRDDSTLAGVPVIVLSNLNQSADIERAKILGAQKFIVKASASLDEIIKNVEAIAVAGAGK
jgi:DNA-binding response OmpR family regulator